jgi:molybdopterin-guanine dinucleotide biosynthesis protein A
MMDRGWTGVVLAGGRSSRMGRDKALLPYAGTTLLERSVELLRPHCREVLIIGDPDKYASAHATTIPDAVPGRGPLGGVSTALRRARYVRLLVVACDLPDLNDRLLIHLKSGMRGDVDAVVPRHGDLVEPLAAAYHRHAIEAIERNLGAGRLRMSDALQAINTHYLALEPGANGWPTHLFRNLNTPGDL